MTFCHRLCRQLTALLLLTGLGLDAHAQSEAPAVPPASAVSPDSSTGDPAGPDPAVEEILVSGTSVTAAIDQARFSESIVDVLSAEDFAATGDSSVVDALSRVTGVTTVGDRYVYVRGLGERYSNTLFNNASLPSPDPVRRVLPLNLFPSSVMQQLSIQKTYAPYLPGDFAGGSLQLTTRTVPTEREAHMSLKMKANSRTTGHQQDWYEGSGSDWSGFDGGYRDLPRIARELPDRPTPQQTQEAGLALERSFDIENKTLPPGFGMDLSYANSKKTPAGDFGIVLGGEIDNEWHFRKEQRSQFVNGQLQEDSPLARTENEVQYTGLGTAVWKPAASQNLRATLFYTHLTQKRYDEEDPITIGGVDTRYRSVFSEWEEQALVTAQLGGDHSIEAAHDLGVDWGVTFSNATREVPDSRFYGYRYPDPPEEGEPLFLSDSSNERKWEELNDDAWDAFVNFSLPVKWSDSILSTFKTGAKYFDKQRESSVDLFRYNTTRDPTEYESLPIGEIFADENINPTYWKLQKVKNLGNQYEAEEEIIAGFLQVETELGPSLRWMVGARYESWTMTTETGTGIVTDLPDDRFFPATELTWLIRNDLQLRGAFSQTVNRPDMRELAPGVIFQNPENGYSYTGYADLNIAELMNYDLRLEWYHGSGDSAELAVFYKDMKNPIEEVLFPVGGLRSWRNADTAFLYGIEVSAQQGLAPLGRWADDFTVRANAAYIKSEATPPSLSESDVQFTNPDHPLQGQSEWVFNFQVAHDYIPWDLQTTLAFNWQGERLSAVGTSGDEDSYETPTPALDFTLKHGFDLFGQSWDMTFKARNLIDDAFEETQDGSVERSYKDGRDFTLSIGKDF